jgi:poly(3-hydroxybutyrate) depolymerase
MMYTAYQMQRDLLDPMQRAASVASSWLSSPTFMPFPSVTSQTMAAALDVFSRLKLTHTRPDYGIHEVTTGAPGHERKVQVHEETVLVRPFGSLLHFVRGDLNQPDAERLPKVLLVAPLSGHFATLLTDTVRTLLADHDVYITDWHNARQVPLSAGKFGLDDYIEQMIEFIATVGEHTHIVAVCQPCVPVLAAVSLMAQRQHPAQPRSMTLMAGPIDCRINPTEVNKLATSKPMEWFEKNMVSHVPWKYPGAMRKVYPGFMQLSAFVAMNPDRHKQAFVDLYHNLLQGHTDKAQATTKFYDEYFAVNDMPAEFYLETVEKVFQTYDLARGELVVNGVKVEPAAIRRTALFTVEGERDDICSIGQTVAAHDLCSGIRPYLKQHHVQLGVGHYGVFSGKRWQQQIYPRVREMIHSLN